MRKAGMLGLAMALSLATALAPAYAVDVDRIEIHSRLGEPLVAEIPITGATPAELQQLQAQLASPTTFARIGLPRPQGVVSDLRFEVVRGARPVIRVTSSQPVQEEFLTFLVQVDAPSGRLVREYSVALGAQPSVPTQLPPEIQAPASAPGNAVVRAPDPQAPISAAVDPANALPPPAQTEVPPVAQAPDVAAPLDVVGAAPVPPPPSTPIPLAGDRRPQSAPAPASPAPVPLATRPAARPATTPPARTAASAPPARTNPRPSATPAAAASQRPAAARPAAAPATPRPAPATTARPGDYTVKDGDNLTGVVEQMQVSGASAAQAMLAVLRTNPQAFASGNINQLRRGAVLRSPSGTELTRFDAATAEVMVRLQTQQWRSGDMPPVASLPEPLQPVSVPAPAAADSPAPAATATASSAADTRTPAAAAARLEIAPAEATSAQNAAGEGDAAAAAGLSPADQARAQADRVAVRYTEFQQMQQRIAELEQAQKAQQRLLELKDRQLAAQQPQSASFWPWLVAALAILAALAALWNRRRPQRRSRTAARVSEMFGNEEDGNDGRPRDDAASGAPASRG